MINGFVKKCRPDRPASAASGTRTRLRPTPRNHSSLPEALPFDSSPLPEGPALPGPAPRRRSRHRRRYCARALPPTSPICRRPAIPDQRGTLLGCGTPCDEETRMPVCSLHTHRPIVCLHSSPLRRTHRCVQAVAPIGASSICGLKRPQQHGPTN